MTDPITQDPLPQDKSHSVQNKLGGWSAMPAGALPLAQLSEISATVKLVMVVVLSLVVMAAALYVLLKNYPASQQKWATSTITFVLGFWFGMRGL